jgi:hypothetical protein
MNIVGTITDFIKNIGIAVHFEPIHQTTFLPGILIRNGELVIDNQKLLYPGDILHEAGHLAVMPPRIRQAMSDDLNFDPIHEGGELAAMAWSYAASVHLHLDASVVFHDEGYKGGGAHLAQSYINGDGIGVPLLVWQQMTLSKDSTVDGLRYPEMKSWLCEVDNYIEQAT